MKEKDLNNLLNALVTQPKETEWLEFKLNFHSKEEIDQILKDLKQAKYIVDKVKKGERKRNPAPPFTTSTMQQEASRKLGFTLRKTMSVAIYIIPLNDRLVQSDQCVDSPSTAAVVPPIEQL